MSKEELFSYVLNHYDVKPDYPFKKHPQYAVLRHKNNKKWFALVMSIPKKKLKITGHGETIAIDIKVNPELISILRGQKGFLPAYHMNKDHWLTMELDGAIEAKTILNLLDESYALTK